MGIKELLAQKQVATAQNSTKRIYADISAEHDATLEKLAALTEKTKKGMIEWLIQNAADEYNAREKETNKRAKKVGKK